MSMMNLASLAEIADRHGCDKGLTGPSRRWSANNYVDVYEALFRPLRFEPLHIQEIGIGVTGDAWDAKVVHGANLGGGASLKTWAEYFPNSKVYGLDINDGSHLNSDRIRTFIVDQSSRSELQSFLAQVGSLTFDIIIDDGSHRADHQQITLETLWPRLKDGRHYFIEDLNNRGFGGDSGGRHEAANTVPTRRLFSSYRSSGAVPRPNAFANDAFLSQIDDIVFYCPQPILRPRDLFIELFRLLLRRGSKGISRTEYSPASYQVVALRKCDADS